jgi:hypothetical protein
MEDQNWPHSSFECKYYESYVAENCDDSKRSHIFIENVARTSADATYPKASLSMP